MSPTPYSCQDIILSRNVEGELSKSEARTPLVRRNGPVGAMYPKGEVMPASEHSGWRRSTLARFPSPEERLTWSSTAHVQQRPSDFSTLS